MLLNRLTCSVIPGLIALSLAACGGGGSSDGNASDDNSSPSVSTSTIQGEVVKGVVRNAIVTAYALDNGQVGSVLSSTETDSLGQYRLSIRGHSGPIYIAVTPNGNSTQMVCDYSGGCGDYTSVSELDLNENGSIDFGESFTVASDFILTTTLPSAASTQAGISTLTHLATQLALSYPQGLNDVSIAVAQSQIENLFAVSDLSSTDLVDLTDSTAVANADADELRYSLMSSALLGISNDAAMAQVLESIVQQLQINNGQLITHTDSGSVPTLLDLIEAALTTAQALDLDTLASEFSLAAAGLLSSESGSLTSAQPSPTAGGTNAEVMESFIADIQLWQGYLSLSPDQPSFGDVVSAIGVSTGADLANLLKAISIAGQFGPVVALPDAALSAACNSLANYFARLACRSLIAGKSLEEICNGSLNLVLFGRSLCDILNDLTLPLGNGLTGDFALWDGVARIYGTTNNVIVDITFTASDNYRSNYGFTINGSAESETGILEITDGRFNLVFDGGLDIQNLKLPETASGNLNVEYTQFTTLDNSNPTSFNGDLSLALDLSGVTEAADDESPYAGLDSIDISMTAAGAFQSLSGDQFDGSITLDGGLDSEIQFQFETDLPDYSDRATITVRSTPQQISQGLIDEIVMEWAGKRYEILYFFAPYYGVRMTNQDGVIVDLDLSVDDNDVAGYLLLNGTRYGVISPLNGSLMFTLSNGLNILL
ncbi:MAG: hypothetical protein VYA55_13375 [Pseudomonadota bacterium]|nr:hypothetical protein [Pseudomonadota bacterium]